MNPVSNIADRLQVHAELCRKLAAQEPREDIAKALRQLGDDCMRSSSENAAEAASRGRDGR
jgi:hypothetical protein